MNYSQIYRNIKIARDDIAADASSFPMRWGPLNASESV